MIIELLDFKNSAIKLYFGVYALESYINARQHRKLLEKEMPEAIQDIVSLEEFENERLYELEKSKHRFIIDILKVVKNYIFIKHDIYPRLWKCSNRILVEYLGFNGSHWFTSFFIFSLILPNVEVLVSLPTTLYQSFVAKKHKGDCSTSCPCVRIPPASRIDLGLSMSTELFPQLYLINQDIPNSYIYVWLFKSTLKAIYELIVPGIVVKKFFKTEPLPEGELKIEIESWAKNTGFPLKTIYTYQLEQKPASFDIFILGKFNTQSVFIPNALVEKSTVEEIGALISREYSIWKSNHALKTFIFGQVCSLGVLYTLNTIIKSQDFYHQFGFSTPHILFGCTMLKVLFTPLKPIVNSFYNLISRRIIRKASKKL
ncbi:hypothetical protein CONCODRAFT_56263 [Conidiobolus coronatus NRRL 28638]|uniref:Uncharacterized protein n=1 Tax=Conidiobolus coronatus (strain ATCC 28846 / CBS 209.66 / NRRL 28638) TaxID=796925 RepID=A0A137PBW1_CONC2|nr:hypothetical protein CONCODRAFT_56263 [Conidiobolus coronatus NRRL 28638]|eukprot:KXN72463.1 hypothetical protein CONCODRAFT_56263 [Conidiobolus coronatus NRRL 28638]